MQASTCRASWTHNLSYQRGSNVVSRAADTHGDVHTLTSLGRVRVSRVPSEEDALVKRVVRGDALANLVNGEPVDVAELELVRLEDLLCRVDAHVLRLLAAIRTGLQLHIEAAQPCLSRDDHDGPGILRVNEALVLDIGECRLDPCIHNALCGR